MGKARTVKNPNAEGAPPKRRKRTNKKKVRVVRKTK